MSILSTIKDALHIGDSEEKKDEETAEEDKLQGATVENLIMPEDENGTIEGFVDTSSEVSGEAKVNVDYWTKKMKAELYRNGVANEVVESTPLELNTEDQRFISIAVPKQHVEKAKEVALEVLGDEKYFIVYEK